MREVLNQEWTQKHVCTNTIAANSFPWESIQTVEQSPRKTLVEAILPKTLKDGWKRLSRIPPEYSDLPKLSLLPTYESLASGCLETHISDAVSLYYFFLSGKLKIVSQLLSISGRLKLTGESLLMSESRRVEFNEFKKPQTTTSVVFKDL